MPEEPRGRASSLHWIQAAGAEKAAVKREIRAVVREHSQVDRGPAPVAEEPLGGGLQGFGTHPADLGRQPAEILSSPGFVGLGEDEMVSGSARRCQ